VSRIHNLSRREYVVWRVICIGEVLNCDITLGFLSAGLPCLQYRGIYFWEQLVGRMDNYWIQIEDNLCKLRAIIPYFNSIANIGR
jgi:hypothetical protein